MKDRAALAMIQQAELRDAIKPGDVLIEANSGNTGIDCVGDDRCAKRLSAKAPDAGEHRPGASGGDARLQC